MALPGLRIALAVGVAVRRAPILRARPELLCEPDELTEVCSLVSDTHVLAQLLSGGQFSEVDDSWIAALGLASRVRLSYTNGPMEFTLSAKHKFGESDVQARLTLGLRF